MAKKETKEKKEKKKIWQKMQEKREKDQEKIGEKIKKEPKEVKEEIKEREKMKADEKQPSQPLTKEVRKRPAKKKSDVVPQKVKQPLTSKRIAEPPSRKKVVSQKPPSEFADIKLFNRWLSSATIKDPGLVNYINLSPRLLPRSAGTQRGRFYKSRMHIVERLALDLMVSGHSGRHHKLSSGRFSGKWENVLSSMQEALAIIEKRQKKNPLQVLADAICNAAVREEITSFQIGNTVAREAVITAPQRRVDKTLRLMAQGSYKRSFRKKKSLPQALADEILAAAEASNQSYAIQEKDRIEREAAGAR